MLCFRKYGVVSLLEFCCTNIKSCRYLNSKIPNLPFELPANKQNSCGTRINKDTIAHLERLSLVDFGNEKGIQILEDAIAFADQITTVNTEGVEPLITVLENCELRLREDKVTDGNSCKDILSYASVTEEDYFIAPPGNIPVTPNTYELKDKTKTVSTNSDMVKKKLSQRSS